MSSPFSVFAQTADAVSATTKRLQKLAILADYLSTLTDEDLAIVCRFLSGLPFPHSDERTLNVGFSAVSTVLIDITGVDPHEYGNLAVRLGDLGEVAAHILPARPKSQVPSLKSQVPTPDPRSPTPKQLSDLQSAIRNEITLRSALDAFEAMASARGAGQKALLLRNLLVDASPQEGKYIVKLVTGDMRMGLKESLVEEALARMVGVCVEEVQKVNMLVGDIGETALMARHGRLGEAGMRLFHPLKFMLATPAEDPSAILAEGRNRGEGEVYIEDKYDGVRAQLHKQGDNAVIYSRTLDPVTHRFPEVTQALLSLPHDVIFDGEIVAYVDDEGRRTKDELQETASTQYAARNTPTHHASRITHHASPSLPPLQRATEAVGAQDRLRRPHS